MALKFLFQRVLKDAALLNIAASVNKRSREYFISKAREIENQRPNRILDRKDIKDNLQSELPFKPGDIFLFNYYPKNAENEKKLPYYDRYPLILLLDIQPEFILGLNFHYLPYLERAILLSQLYRYLNEDEITVDDIPSVLGEKAFVDIDYTKVQNLNVPKKYWKPCFKKYLNNNIRGRMLKIHPQEWDILLQLPLERFVRANRQTVWRESNVKWNK